MNKFLMLAKGCLGMAILGLGLIAGAAEPSIDDSLSVVAQRFDELSFETTGKRQRRTGFENLLADLDALQQSAPSNAAVLAWQGIVLSTYAGEVSMFSAMKYAEAAREALQRAEGLDPLVLGAGVYTSLGALYAAVPGGMIGFGDDELALEYLRRAVEIDPEDPDAIYFLADLLIDLGSDDEAMAVLTHGLNAPAFEARPVLTRARREEMQAMLARLNR